MSEHITEEEQIEALKRWWRDYGNHVLTGVTLALAIYFGSQWWKNSQLQHKEAGSAQFQQLLDATQALRTGNADDFDDEQRTTAQHLIAELKDSHKDSFYGQSAALLAAKLAVETSDLEQAVVELQWVLGAKPSDAIKAITTGRLARVLLAQGKLDEALALVKTPLSEGVTSQFAEIRGDVLAKQGDSQAARSAYQVALDTLPSADQGRRELLTLKLNNQPAPDTTPQGDA